MKTFMMILLQIIVPIGLMQGAIIAEAVYHYEPEEVKLIGTLTEKTFYGPPGYGEDPKKDSKEQAYLLVLERPITVIPVEQDEINEKHQNVIQVQIVNTKQISLGQLLSKTVVVKGTLFSAITGHHHTEVLINATEASPCNPNRLSNSSGTAEFVVSSLYSDYPADGAESIEAQPKQVLSKYFNDSLANLLLKDQQCQQKEQGICNLDFMILYDAQDYDINDLQVSPLNQVDKTVRVRFKNFQKPIMIVYQMSQTAGGWKVSDIRYEKGHSLSEILSQ